MLDNVNPLVKVGIIAFTCMAVSLMIYADRYTEYEYIDENGVKGYAKECVPNIPYSTCYKEDGTSVKVIKYYERLK